MARQDMEITLGDVDRHYHNFSHQVTCGDEARGVWSRGRPAEQNAKETGRMSVDPVSVLLWIVAPLMFWGAVAAGLVVTLGG